MWAKVNGIPVITWAPRVSHYVRSHANLLGVDIADWVHPFVYSLSDAIVDSPEDGARWIRDELLTGKVIIKDRHIILNAMEYYRTTQFPNDIPMQEMFARHPGLATRAYQRIS